MTYRLLCALLFLSICASVAPASASDNWNEYVLNGQSVANSSTAVTFTDNLTGLPFRATYVQVVNAGAQSCHVRYRSTGNATTSDLIIRAGAGWGISYFGNDVSTGGGYSGIKVICPSTSTVDVYAVRPQ